MGRWGDCEEERMGMCVGRNFSLCNRWQMGRKWGDGELNGEMGSLMGR